MDALTNASGKHLAGEATAWQGAVPLCFEVAVHVEGLRPASAPVGPGKPFTEEAHTLLVLPHGAVLELAVPLVADHRVNLKRNDSGRRVQCRVACVRQRPNAKALVELEFAEPARNFWETGKTQAEARERQSPAPPLATNPPPAIDESAREVILSPRTDTPPAPTHLSTARVYEQSQPTKELEEILGIHEAPQHAEPKMTLQASGVAQETASLAVRNSVLGAGLAAPSLRPFGSSFLSPVQSATVEMTGRRRGRRKMIWVGATALVVLGVSAGALFHYRVDFYNPLQAELPAPPAPIPPPETWESSVPAATASITLQPEEGTLQVEEKPVNGPSKASSKQESPVAVGPTAAPAKNSPATNQAHSGRSLVGGPLSAPIVKRPSGLPGEEPAPTVEVFSESIPVSNTISGLVGGASRTLPAATSSVPPPKPGGAGGQVKPPKLIKSFPPAYPPVARQRKMEGDVVVEAAVDAAGNVERTRIVSGPAFFHQVAIDAMRNWKYQPATLNNQPVAADVLVVLKFRINQ